MRYFISFAAVLTLFILLNLSLVSCSPGRFTSYVSESGVPEDLAKYRKNVLSNVSYSLQLSIPPLKEDPIAARETIRFEWKANKQPLPIDFKEKASQLKEVRVNGKGVSIDFQKEHIFIDPKYLQEGENVVDISFIAGNLSLNRNADYLYTLLVPDRARTVFPCFDQPDLKANFQLTLVVPQDWQALSNGALRDSSVATGTKAYVFAPSDPVSTYLFSFAAGRFNKISSQAEGRSMHFYHRETDSNKIRLSTDSVFRLHREALNFLEAYTQIPYPFQKFDFVAIPDFQYGGMEHPGAIQYRASTLFLDEGATKDQLIGRASLVAHETAHMWFGDLVTMRWFDDVWTKEVFANFMADKVHQSATSAQEYDLKFLINHFPAAYGVDRSKGANPIRQLLSNLQDAGSLYGNIIYHKAPIMMRQLERLMGTDAFRDGLRAYLKKYAMGNSSWPELIEILDERTPVNLKAWNKVWVNESGRPQLNYQLIQENHKIKELVISQQSEDGTDKVWPQYFEVALVYPDSVAELTVLTNGRQVRVKEAEGKAAPRFILFNSSGQGYGVFPVDSLLLRYLDRLDNPVMRASAYINLYENMLNGRSVAPIQLLEVYRSLLSKEKEELNLQLLCGQLSDVFWRLIPIERRTKLASTLEKDLLAALESEPVANKKKVLFRTYQSIALSKEAQDRLYGIWKNERPPQGVRLTEEDYTGLALALAVRDYQDSTLLAQQLKRIKNPDRQKRLTFLLPALSPNESERDRFFESLKQETNREKEAWVTTALGYLHHPLRGGSSKKYLRSSLDLLEEIQLTGDIFFPMAWLQATFGSYQSEEAALVVRRFLDEHPKYNPKLKGKILQAADGVFRAEALMKEYYTISK